MNLRVVIAIIVILLATCLIGTVGISKYFHESLNVETTHHLLDIYQNSNSLIIKNIRQDLLIGNTRGAERYLNQLVQNRTIQKYTLSVGGIGSKSSMHCSEILVSTDVSFSPGSTEIWGTLHSCYSKATSESVVNTILNSFIYTFALSSIIVVFLILTILGLLWHLNGSLSHILTYLIRHEQIPIQHWSSRLIWGDALLIFENAILSFKENTREREKVMREAEIGILVTQVAHDIRSPLST
ncbi:MAG: hypothetical protein KAG61_08060, partial [Bacteriovoracaceae bacterium]|nr:hypothetical protein [Bacteriovoracaceae bacterium]